MFCRYARPHGPYLVATLDPATTRVGLCIGHPDGRVIEARTLRGRTPAATMKAAMTRVRKTATALGLTVAWVVEEPQRYDTRRAAHSDLDGLDVQVGVLRRGRGPRETLTMTRPHGWKGNVPKAVHHARLIDVVGARWRGVVDPDADAYDNDAADAVGLLLWACGVVGRGGVLTRRRLGPI